MSRRPLIKLHSETKSELVKVEYMAYFYWTTG